MLFCVQASETRACTLHRKGVITMEYTFDMGSFMTNLMYYATEMFNNLVPIGAIVAGLSFGIGLVLLVIRLVSGALKGI